jgi:DNA-binding SARP family transcriptional activator/TolB-like protein/Tfp pilus assembly protein PilF
VDEQGAELRAVLSQPKRLGLLVHLALADGEFVRRDTLLALLWPELDEESARRALRQSLHFLRSHLGSEALPGRGDDEVGLATEHLWCDVTAFRRAVNGGQLEEALELYRGDLLPGFFVREASPDFDDRLGRERDALHRSAVEAARTLARRDEEKGNLSRALRWALRWLELAPTDGIAVRGVMRLDHALEDRRAALETYDAFARRLRDDGGGHPDRETRALADTIRRELAAWTPAPVTPLPRPPAPERPPVAAPAVADAESPSVQPPAAARGRVPPWALGLGALATLALAALGASRLAARGTDARTLAVLPFADAQGDTAAAWFAEGISAEIANRLSGVASLRVLPPHRSSQRAAAEPDLLAQARRNGARHALVGDVRRVGGRVLVNARLLDTRTGVQRWGASYDVPRDTLYVMQGRIARSVAGAVQAGLAPGELSKLTAVPTRDSIAHNAYLRGLAQFMHFTGPEMQRAQASLQLAVQRDPNYAPALFALARTYFAQSAGFGGMAPAQAAPRIRELADRLLALDAESGEGLLLHAMLLSWFEWDWAGADRAFRRALAVAPANADTHTQLGFLLIGIGRLDSARAEVQRAADLDPLYPRILANPALVATYQHRWEECLTLLERVFAIDPNFAGSVAQRATCLAGLGRRAEVRREAQRALSLGRGTPRIVAEVIGALARAGDTTEARRLLDGLLARADLEEIDPGLLALGFAAVGDRDAALVWLDRMIVVRSRWVLALMSDPNFDTLRADPRFAAIVDRAGLTPYVAGADRPARTRS